ncbi:MAG: ATP-dependent sacrificial sulfur transferase LarE [Candidatus Methanogranum gryphiswaldense]|nr:MAG: ATP-dependent sacrificial sulfur transferase LarE [Candidatus Methanogranum sp. U3.2.1]
MQDAYSLFGDYLKSAGKVAIAYSGGFDSAFMLAAASEFIPDDHIAIFVDTPMVSNRQRKNAKIIAETLNSPLIIVNLEWQDMPEVTKNNGQRCYFCKSAIYDNVRSIALDLGCDVSICGDNYDDLSADRPGRKAVDEYHISKPLEDLKISRKDIVEKVKSLDLGCTIIKDTCLSTRIPFGTPINENTMRSIESYEQAVRDLCGIEQVRFRYQEYHAKIQTSPPEIYRLKEKESELRNYFSKKGISIEIDPDGYKG